MTTMQSSVRADFSPVIDGDPKPVAKARKPRVVKTTDPAAKSLAETAMGLKAPSRTSNYTARDAREFIDHFRVSVVGDDEFVVERFGYAESVEPVVFKAETFAAFAVDSLDDAEARKSIRKTVADLTKPAPSTTLYGAKFALFALASLAVTNVDPVDETPDETPVEQVAEPVEQPVEAAKSDKSGKGRRSRR
jgi:hypothetical protein